MKLSDIGKFLRDMRLHRDIASLAFSIYQRKMSEIQMAGGTVEFRGLFKANPVEEAAYLEAVETYRKAGMLPADWGK